MIGTVIGGGTGGQVQTQGPSGTAITVVNAAGMTTANGIDTTATGLGASATGTGASAYGAYATANGAGTTAIGYRSLATHPGSVAVGQNARAIADPATAIGDNSLASGIDSVAVGANSQATATRAVAIGANSIAAEANTVSVGAAGSERRVTNVAAGINPTDAVNVGQLTGVRTELANVAKIAYSGTAMSLALTGAVMPTLDPGEMGFGIGVGHYKGYSALGFNFKGLSRSGDTAFGVGVSTTGKEWGLSLGMGFKWK